MTWVSLYVGLGYAFNDRVQSIADILGNLVWVIVGLLVAGFLGWKLWQYLRTNEEKGEISAAPADGVR